MIAKIIAHKKIVALAGILLIAFALSGCVFPEPENPPQNAQDVQRFSDYNELKSAFEQAANSGRNYGIGDMMIGIATMPMMATSDIAESAGSKSADYSTTNVQVEGVDEADIVKTDGEYIYNFSQNSLVITKAYPIEEAKIVSQTKFDGVTPQEMFVDGERLVLFGYAYNNYYNEPWGMPQPAGREAMPPFGWGGNQVFIVQLYDIGDRASPSLEKEVEFQGSYLTSRLIGRNAYFVVNSYPNYYYAQEVEGEENIIPMMRENGLEKRIAQPSEIAYIPPMMPQSFVTIASMNLDSGKIEKEVVAGNAQTVYASEENIYFASTQYFAPETPILKDLERTVIGDSEKTIINKFSLKNGEIKFEAQGNVPGHVLNQFSLDEYAGNFRIATTIGQVWRGPSIGEESKNNVYILDKEMDTIGKLEDLAPGEKIYSARFMAERVYLVTFKKVDPLFVIDASDPTNPKVLGKLKIPGYSDYLHPIDEGHIIGIGKDTIESGTGDFAWYQGIKMAVFDVSDVENPKEMHKIVIGDRGTDSYALSDHKAFLYDKEKELLVIPVMLAQIPKEQKEQGYNEWGSPAYGVPVFQGAMVFRLTLENGFEERGRITHISEEEELKRGYYYGNEYSVKRSLYISDVLFTLSDKMLKANSLSTLEPLKEFVFG
ncbi:MAG: beta-propeller domain-containing protein [archaeon]|nr:beta-propeller domain-containing protein [archaeon]